MSNKGMGWHIHWHNFDYTLHDNWMMHIDVHKCRCGSVKIKTGEGYSPYRFYPSGKQMVDAIGRPISELLATKSNIRGVK